MLKEFESRKYSSTLRLSAAWLKANLFKRGIVSKVSEVLLAFEHQRHGVQLVQTDQAPKEIGTLCNLLFAEGLAKPVLKAEKMHAAQ